MLYLEYGRRSPPRQFPWSKNFVATWLGMTRILRWQYLRNQILSLQISIEESYVEIAVYTYRGHRLANEDFPQYWRPKIGFFLKGNDTASRANIGMIIIQKNSRMGYDRSVGYRGWLHLRLETHVILPMIGRRKKNDSFRQKLLKYGIAWNQPYSK